MTAKAVLLPKNWKAALSKKASGLPFPDVAAAFDGAIENLDSLTEAEVVALAHKVCDQYRSALGNGPAGRRRAAEKIDPRLLYSICAGLSQDDELSEVPLTQQFAAAVVVEVARACDKYAAATDHDSWVEATKSIAAACSLSDCMVIFDMATDSVEKKKDIRAAAKAKIKKDKSSDAKLGWRKALKLDKTMVIDYYEQHQTKFKSLPHAATVIEMKKLVPYKRSTILTWLRKHDKKTKGLTKVK